MFKSFVSFVLLFTVHVAVSQQPVFHWAKAVLVNPPSNLDNYSNGRTVGTDAIGNVYAAGLFQHTMDFDPGPEVYNLSIPDDGYSGIYILKLDAKGNFLWAKQIPTVVEFGDIELKVTRDGTVYLASNLPDPADMDPGPGVLMMTPIGAKDAFVIKLDTNGNLVWAKQFGGPGDTVPESNALEVDKDNNVIISGLFNNTVDFDPGPGTFNLTSTAHLQAYIVKLSSNGDIIWAKQFGNAPVVYSGSHIIDLKCDSKGNIYTVGGFKGSCDFDPGPGVYTLTGNTYQDGFISKLDGNGNFVWAKSLNGANYDNLMQSRAIDVDGIGNLIMTGAFIGTFDLDPGPGVHAVSANPFDCYILKLDGQGNFLLAKTIGGSEFDAGNDLAIDNNNNVYLIGSFGPSVDFDPGPGTFIINSPGYGASALVKLDGNGNFVYAASFPGSGFSSFSRMWVDGAQNIYVTGSLSGTIDFDPGPKEYPVSSSYGSSPFVLKLGRCKNVTTSTLNISTCTSYTLNNQTFDTSGTYQQIIPNASGCDSVITLLLTITKKVTQQTKEICEGSFFFAGGANQTTTGTYADTLQTSQGCDSIVTTYLYVNPKPLPDLGPDRDICRNTHTITPGSFKSYVWQDNSTGNSFTVNTPGVYWVRVTNNFNCTATDTFKVKVIFPAPTNFLKDKDSICTYGSLDIVSANAYRYYQWSNGAAERKVSVQSPGIYWLQVTDVNGCSGRDSIAILPKQCMSGVYLPTAFTPNGDGKNDFFKALVYGKVLSFKLQIFERGGQIVFQTADPSKQWDGRNKGVDYSTSAFVWQCFYQLEGQQPGFQKGTVLLVR